jgi:Flp pilus assembly CpaE family ATPase
MAAILAQNQRNTVLIDLDFAANDCAMQIGAAPAHSFQEVGENLNRLDQSLFEGLLVRDNTGFLLLGPPEQLESRPDFSGSMFRNFANFLVEKYDNVVVDGGRWITDDLTLAALESSSTIFLVLTPHFPAIRNGLRYLASLARMGFTQDQVKLVLNMNSSKADPNLATVEQIQQTLNQKLFAKIPMSSAALPAVNKGRPIAASKTGETDRVLRAFVDKATGVKPAVKKTA